MYSGCVMWEWAGSTCGGGFEMGWLCRVGV